MASGAVQRRSGAGKTCVGPRHFDRGPDAGLLDAIQQRGYMKKNGAIFLRGNETCNFDFANQSAAMGWDHTFQVPRADYDKTLADTVAARGVEILYNHGVVAAHFDDDGATVTIGTTVYTFKTTLTGTAGQVKVGGTADLSLQDVDATVGPGLAPLTLASVSGRLGGKRLQGGFELGAENLQFQTREGERWPGGNLPASLGSRRDDLVRPGAARWSRQFRRECERRQRCGGVLSHPRDACRHAWRSRTPR